MRTARSTTELRPIVRGWKQSADSVALVPTMGALHEGHLALIRQAGRIADKVVVSIFVNPTQFNDAADFERYPRDIARDSRLLEECGCDLLFLPEVTDVYPPGYSTYIEVEGVSEGLEGAFRPGHFRGVATVVARLFWLVQPDIAVFGEKDAQQLAVIRRLVRDLNFDIDIHGHPTIREDDGLAMSSRNQLLGAKERAAATIYYRALQVAAELIQSGETDADVLRARMHSVVDLEPMASLEYAEVVDPDTFQPVDAIDGDVLMPIAGTVGSTRLIDNLYVDPRPTPTHPRG